MIELVESKCNDREVRKFKSYMEDVETITKLLLKLSRRLARAENELRNAPMDATDDDKVGSSFVSLSFTLPEPQGLGPRSTQLYKSGPTTLEPHRLHIYIYINTTKLRITLQAIPDLSFGVPKQFLQNILTHEHTNTVAMLPVLCQETSEVVDFNKVSEIKNYFSSSRLQNARNIS